VQRAIATQRQPVPQLGETDEDEAEQSAAVPVVVEQDVKVLECVLVQEMGLVEGKTGWTRSSARSSTWRDTAQKRLPAVAAGDRPRATQSWRQKSRRPRVALWQ
jgi:hypothetical protein